ncbi:MAG TPA: DUF3486 family protein [Thiolapillus brandeum]|uniref:DUF3486 family protein n=1 Tax=Thiolapillus brandeum TaxID=1076588 RepID=A0A7C5N3C7_9GAMM|nr:DUF3486 family protein [Thiolapillus brandeum]
MPRPSTIDRLPPDVLEKLQELLRDPRVTQLEATRRINAILEEDGRPERLSKSSVNRYAQRMERVGERLRQSREVAEMWIARLGAQPQGQLGHLVNEILRTFAFDLSLQLQDGLAALDEETMPAAVKMVKELSIAIHRLEQAAGENVKREAEIREQARREAAEAAEKVARQGGLSADSVQEIRRAILGVRDP